MDSSPRRNDAQRDEVISALVSDFFDRCGGGESLTPERFIREHPEAAEELRQSFQGLALIERACGSIYGATDGESPEGEATLPVIPGYHLVEEIGRGGMGVVFKALQLSTKRTVALKVILTAQFASATAQRRFDREVELAARLEHPGIARVLEGGRAAGQSYYTMDYVSGVKLDRYVSESHCDIRTLLKLFIQLCEVVDYAHAHGVIHRDLKPANVLIDEDDHPHVLDFGLAKETDPAGADESLSHDISLPGQVLGTLSPSFPEQAAGTTEDVDRRTDVYALGVMLYEAVTGSLPVDTAGNPSQVIRRILEEAPAPPSSFSDRVDSELETIMLKALEKDREHRYHSVAEMADDLRRYLAGEPILARRPSKLYVLRKKIVKHRIRVAAGTILVVLVMLSFAARAWWKQRDLAMARETALSQQQGLEEGASGSVLGAVQALIERHPELPEASLLWAQALYRNESLPRRAIMFLEGRLSDEPAEWYCRTLLAEIYEAAGDSSLAQSHEARAEQEAPDTAEAWYVRSFAALDLHRARQCAREAVQREPSHVLAWRRLAFLGLKTGALDDSLEGADQLIRMGEDPAEWTFFKGRAFASQGRFTQAIDAYSQSISLEPEGSRAYRFRAHAYRRIGSYIEAVDDYTAAIELSGEDVLYALPYQRTTPLWILGRTDEALEDYRRVREMLGGPFYADARRFLILRELGRVREADEVLQAGLSDVKEDWLRLIFRCLDGQLTPGELVAIAVDRDNPEQECEACYYAGEVCLLSNQPVEARRWFERCVQTGVQFDPDTSSAVPMNEYELAQWRLKSLPGGITEPPPEEN